MVEKSRARLQATCDFPSYHSKNYTLTNNKEVSIVIRQTNGWKESSRRLLFVRRGLSCGRGIGTITTIPPTAERRAAVGNQVDVQQS